MWQMKLAMITFVTGSSARSPHMATDLLQASSSCRHSPPRPQPSPQVRNPVTNTLVILPLRSPLEPLSHPRCRWNLRSPQNWKVWPILPTPSNNRLNELTTVITMPHFSTRRNRYSLGDFRQSPWLPHCWRHHNTSIRRCQHNPFPLFEVVRLPRPSICVPTSTSACARHLPRFQRVPVLSRSPSRPPCPPRYDFLFL